MSKHLRILHIAHGIPSYNNSLVEMVNCLSTENVEICVASHVDLSVVLSDCAVRFFHLHEDADIQSELQEHRKSVNSKNRLVAVIRRLKLLKQYRHKSLQMKEIRDLTDTIKPNFLFVDIECHVAVIQLYNRSISMMLCSRWFSVFRADGIPPMHTALMPSANHRQALTVKIHWYLLWGYKGLLNISYRFSRQSVRPISYACNARSDLETLAKYNGLNLSKITERRDWLIPHTYRFLPVVSLTNKELEFGGKLDSRMFYVGPMVGSDQLVSERNKKTVDLVQQFVHRHSTEKSRKLVYCSLSTFWDTNNTVFSVLASLSEKRHDIDFVIGMGGRKVPDFFKNLPENMLALDFAPQLAVMHFADVVITHGGISTINEALFHGVPLIVCSAAHVDQNGCAARVEYHGVGVVCPPNSVNARVFEELLDRIFDDDGDIQNRVRHIQKTMQYQKDNHALLQCLYDESVKSSLHR